jgi:hypothetical protein
MNEVEDSHIDFFTSLVEEKLASDSDLVIFDRLYMTQAFRSKRGVDAYKKVEDLLLSNNSLTIFLKVKEKAIADRVYKASQHREADWEEYIKTRGQSIEQIAEYYSVQQSSQLELLKTSAIPYKIFDTTEHHYQEISQQLVILATES